MRIPFYKPSLGDAEIAEVIDTLKSGWLTTGPKTKQFERDFAAYVGSKHAVAVNSCTAALHLALEAVGIREGDGVLVPAMTFAATAEVVRYLHANPILVDCREADFNLDVADAERRVEVALAKGQRVTAIMPVHYGGQIGDMDGVAALARKHNLKIIEDAAHCCPAFWKEDGRWKMEDGGQCVGNLRPCGPVVPSSRGPSSEVKEPRAEDGGQLTTDALTHWRTETPPIRLHSSSSGGQADAPSPGGWLPVGTTADVACFSFYANKCITTGEGGMACTANDEYADRMRIMSLHGISRDAWKRYTNEGSWYYEIIAPGYKYNLTDIAAAIGLHQLRKADAFHRRRSELVRRYVERLQDIEELILPQLQPRRVHSWHLFVIRLRTDRLALSRSEFIDRLKEAGIGTSVHYTPLHMHPYYRDRFGYRPEDLPVMAGVYPQIVTLPLYPDMTEGDVDYICDTIRGLTARGLKTCR